jgi:hypothetical protein
MSISTDESANLVQEQDGLVVQDIQDIQDSQEDNMIPDSQSIADTFSAVASGRKRHKTSLVWEYFKEYNGFFQCLKCNQLYSTSSGNSTLIKHLKKVHDITEEIHLQGCASKQTKLDNNSVLISGRPLSDARKRALTNSIVLWVIDSMSPFSCVENNQF